MELLRDHRIDQNELDLLVRADDEAAAHRLLSAGVRSARPAVSAAEIKEMVRQQISSSCRSIQNVPKPRDLTIATRSGGLGGPLRQ
jgi:hypothetical protein